MKNAIYVLLTLINLKIAVYNIQTYHFDQIYN